ncbi:MAG: hypothetical protein U1B77_01455, partial [Dehalococcoidales bacterium]|nr:hypothetical protein [Dehalococcoidales bacterium]
MIALLTQIWNQLTITQRVICVTFITLVIIAVCVFIWGQTRRELMVLPRIIYKMSQRANEVTQKLTILT